MSERLAMVEYAPPTRAEKVVKMKTQTNHNATSTTKRCRDRWRWYSEIRCHARAPSKRNRCAYRGEMQHECAFTIVAGSIRVVGQAEIEMIQYADAQTNMNGAPVHPSGM